MDKQPKKIEIIEASLKLFYQYGFHAIGIGKILEEAGVSKAELQEHFHSKEELIVTALLFYHDQFLDQLKRFVKSRERHSTDDLLSVFDFVEQVFNGDHFYGCIFTNAVVEFSDRSETIHGVCRRYKQTITDFFRHLAKKANTKNPVELAEKLSILLDGAIVTAQVSGKKDSAQKAKEIASLLIQSESAPPR